MDKKLWIGNVKGNEKAFRKQLSYAEKHRLTPCVVGDLILRGNRPVECIDMALNHVDKIIIGPDTHLMFSAMQGVKGAYALLKRKGGERLFRQLRPFESMVQSLFDKGECLYRDPESMVVVGALGIPKGFNINQDCSITAKSLFEVDKNHESMVKQMRKTNVLQVICGSLRNKRFEDDGIVYLGAKNSTVAGYDTVLGKINLTHA